MCLNNMEIMVFGIKLTSLRVRCLTVNRVSWVYEDSIHSSFE